MEKLGVVEDESLTKEASGEKRAKCPQCGAALVSEVNVAKCPNCGTKPFEGDHGEGQ